MRRATVLLVLGCLVLAGCGSSVERRAVDGLVDSWTGGPFYELPNPVAAGAPGAVVRTERLGSAPDGATAWRVLYHSRDVNDADLLTSGVVVAPSGPAPAGGRTVVSWAHPTTGTAPRCAPSVGADPFDLMEGLSDLLAAGYVVAAADYPGMGAAGPPSYLIGVTTGNAVLDAARAARTIPEAGASQRLLLWGHSQGGHAALFAGQLAATYAPELTLAGVAVAAPATDLGDLLTADIVDVSGVTIGSYAFQAYATAYNAPLDTILTPDGVTATPKMAALCLLGQNAQLHDIAGPLVGRYLAADPTRTQPWAGLLAANTPGAARLPVPLYVAQGEADTLVRPQVTAAFVAKECSLGTRVTSVTLPGVDHGGIAFDALPTVVPWLKNAEAGTVSASTC
ncbi:alpha/beta fold hydrolase [Pseudonocardia sp. N23]|uniref:alpha/beta hydrolase n=1 Tax=Pseudonocardia sp. N23 TaxID=1987376 RepID=UPI000C02E52F|nr:alpha/beta fold hydrolase [Pseudonocardia sp. N23]GAY09738.1 lysophospholipase [Pseudonocardia sp. N23]